MLSRPSSRRRRAMAALCLLLSGPGGAQAALAQDVTGVSGSWQYGADTELAAASTLNERGWMFGLVCSPDCIGFIEHDQPCEAGRRYAGRMRIGGREHAVPLECRRVAARHAFLFTPTEDFVARLASGPEVTVSVRLAGEADTDFRFSLNGAYDAVYFTLATAMAATRRPAQPAPDATGGSIPDS